jgi:CRP-like cAMP-binding protein
MNDIKYTLMKFPKGAYIMMEGEENRGEFFIIKTGSVEIYNPHFLEDDKHIFLGPGNFFGVIPCMTKRNNMETVRAVEDTTTILVKKEQFKDLLSKNPSIGMKMIRYFSKELRNYDEMLGKIIARSPAFNDETELDKLFFIGEYYYNRSNFEYAFVAYRSYLENSEGNFFNEAKIKLEKLSKVSIKKPQENGKFLTYQDKQLIFLEGERGNELYVIQDGRVKITKFINGEEVLLDILKKGDIFGEMAIIENKPRNASAFAEGTTTLMSIKKENFEEIIKTYPVLATKIIELLSERIWVVYRQLTNMFISTPEIKIYDALYTQLLKYRVTLEKKKYIFPFGAEDLLKFIGLANEEGFEVWRQLKQNDKNFSITPNGKIQYNDISQLPNKINFILREKEIRENKKKFSQLVSS